MIQITFTSTQTHTLPYPSFGVSSLLIRPLSAEAITSTHVRHIKTQSVARLHP